MVPGTVTKPILGLPTKLSGLMGWVPQIAILATGATDGIGFT